MARRGRQRRRALRSAQALGVVAALVEQGLGDQVRKRAADSSLFLAQFNLLFTPPERVLQSFNVMGEQGPP